MSRCRRWIGSRCAIFLIALSADSTFANGLESLDLFLKGTQTARASFVQSVTQPAAAGAASGAVPRVRQSSGTFEFQRPDRFRFSYAKPFAQTIVADGQTLWYHDAELNQVTARAQAQALASTPAALFATAADTQALAREFDLQGEPEREGLQWVVARPRKGAGREALVREVRVGLRAAGAGVPPALAVVEIVDAFGQRSLMRFADFERNTPPRRDAFVFKPPAGADVVRQ